MLLAANMLENNCPAGAECVNYVLNTTRAQHYRFIRVQANYFVSVCASAPVSAVATPTALGTVCHPWGETENTFV